MASNNEAHLGYSRQIVSDCRIGAMGKVADKLLRRHSLLIATRLGQFSPLNCL